MRNGFRSVLAATFLCLAGCQSYYGSGYTGTYDIPQGGIYAPPQSRMTVVQPTQPATTWQRQGAGTGAMKAAQPPAGAQAQPNGAAARGQKLVPEPLDAGGASGRDPADLPEETRNRRGVKSPSGVELDSISDAGEEEVAAQNEDENFADPLPVRPVSTTTTTGNVTRQAVQSRPNPYHYDRKGYTWLRGVLSFDERDKSWFVTYNPEPDESDLYGGRMTLANSEELDAPLADDVVYLEGQVAADQKDRFGKPMFRVRKALLLKPNAQ